MRSSSFLVAFIWDAITRTGVIPKQAPLQTQNPEDCPLCHAKATVVLERVDQQLTIFMLPILPAMRGKVVKRCQECNTVIETTRTDYRVTGNEVRSRLRET